MQPQACFRPKAQAVAGLLQMGRRGDRRKARRGGYDGTLGRLMNSGYSLPIRVSCAGLLFAAGLLAQDKPATPLGKWQIGVRIEGTPRKVFKVGVVAVQTTTPIATFEYTGVQYGRKVNGAPTVEYRFSKRFTLGADFRFEPVEFAQQTEVWSGNPDPNSSYDNRAPSYFIDDTKIDYLEIPVMARAFPFSSKGWFSRVYVLAGGDIRHIMRIRTDNEYHLANGIDYTDNVSDVPSTYNQLGAVVGVGFRFIDDFNVKTMPEIRYVKWRGTPFQGVAYRSAPGQLEFSVGFSF